MSTFSKAVIREIGRNVGKGISNDLFGDWHATPVRGAKSSSDGFDLSFVQPEEFDVTAGQPEEREGSLFGAFLYGFFGTVTILPMIFIPIYAIVLVLRSKTNLYARVPSRRRDGRTKTGYREMGYHYVKLKSKRLLTSEEKKNLKLYALFLLLGSATVILLSFYAVNYL